MLNLSLQHPSVVDYHSLSNENVTVKELSPSLYTMVGDTYIAILYDIFFNNDAVRRGEVLSD